MPLIHSRHNATDRSLEVVRDIILVLDDMLVRRQWHAMMFTARCTLLQSAVLRSHVRPSVCLSVCDVGEL